MSVKAKKSEADGLLGAVCAWAGVLDGLLGAVCAWSDVLDGPSCFVERSLGLAAPRKAKMLQQPIVHECFGLTPIGIKSY